MNVEEIIRTNSKMPIRSRSLIHMQLVNNKVKELITQALKPFGVSAQQFNVLRILKGQKGQPANLSTLNDRMVTKMSNTTRLVDKLLQKGLVERQTCPSNRRKVEINITQIGIDELEKMSKAVEDAEYLITNNLTDKDLNELNKLLDKF